MDRRTQTIGNERIVYDARRLPAPAARWFDPDYLRAHAALRPEAAGRGSVWRFRAGEQEYVLRHYRRGGRIAHVLGDQYFRLPFQSARPAREAEMLGAMRARGLPVPEPVAYRICSLGPFYRADLVTARIPQAQSLLEHLARRGLEEAHWRALGAVLRRFHDADIWHADLNLGNIVVTPGPDFHLVDFDRAAVRRGERWKRDNILRLLRSWRKQERLHPDLHFRPQDFHALYDAYRGSTP